LTGCKNFVGEREEFIFIAFIYLEPVQRSEDGCDMRTFRSFNHSPQYVQDSSESAGGDLFET